MAQTWRSLNADMDALVERVRRSLVHVSNGPAGQGTGIIWRDDGLIVTNAHVTRYDNVSVTLADDRVLTGRVEAYDTDYDLALIMVPARGLQAMTLGSSAALRAGQWVLAMGYPWGVPDGATAGVVIGVGHHPQVQRYPGDLVQVSFHLRPGHSGGPLVNSQGELVGINAMIAGPDVGLAVPVDVAKAFVHQALKHSRAA